MTEEKYVNNKAITSSKQEFATVQIDKRILPIDEDGINDGGGIIGFLLKLIEILTRF